MLETTVVFGTLKTLITKMPRWAVQAQLKSYVNTTSNRLISAAEYSMAIVELHLPLSAQIGRCIRIKFLGSNECTACGRAVNSIETRGYCKCSFYRLARCDLCFVSPDRCHFALGPCRGQDWSESYCMQPSAGYLANSSGPKDGITRQGQILIVG